MWGLPFEFLVGAGVFVHARYWNDGALTRRDGTSLLALYFVFVSGRVLLFPGQ